MTDDNFHKLSLNESFERVAKVAEERQAFNKAMDRLIAQDADLIDLQPTQADIDAAESIFWVETIIDDKEAIAKAFARHRQYGYEAGVEAAAKALEADAELCDCSAYEDGECACGAWCEWKSIPSARAVEIVNQLKDTK